MNFTKEQAIKLAKKALKDIGHWEDFKIENANFWDKDPPYDYNHWLVSFNFEGNDWSDIAPMLVINDEKGIVTFVSWKKSEFLLSYDKEKDKYFHPTLSREQPKLK
jgi:hypothetical protein